MTRPHLLIPIEVATTPRDGECKVNRWWITTPDGEIVIYNGMSPQCNDRKVMIDALIEQNWPEHTATFLEVVYLGHTDFNGFYHRRAQALTGAESR